MVIDDELQSAQFVTLKKDTLVAGDSLPLVTGSFSGTPIRVVDDGSSGEPLPLDGEGVAFADGFFYVIGSHGHPRGRGHKLYPIRDAAEIEAKIMASSKIVRIKADSRDAKTSYVLRHLIRCDPVLKDFADRRLDENGVTIEGVAVREDRLFAGFRGPVLPDGKAVILSVSLAALFDGAAPDPRLHRVDLRHNRGVRDLAPWAEGLLVLAGPSGGEKGNYSVFFWDTSSKDVTRLGRLPDVKSKDGKQQFKAEAILPLDQNAGKLRILVFFDGAGEGGPRDFPVDAPPHH
jgi:hypothetical protein